MRSLQKQPFSKHTAYVDSSVLPEVHSTNKASLSQATTRLDELEREKRTTIEADTDRYAFSKWLHRAGWARHLKGLRRDWLLIMARKPTYQERALFEVCWAVRMVIWRAQQAYTASVVGMPAIMYINRREFGSSKDETPFNAQQMEKTMIQYSNVRVEVIAYIWRTHELGVVKPRNSGEEIEGKRPPYHINGKQDTRLQRIRMIVGQDKSEENTEESDRFDSSDESSNGSSKGSSNELRLSEQQEEKLEGHA
ncbi:hypothetical protein PSPO01_15540 [Paraphaeosphaeria sporulosa]